MATPKNAIYKKEQRKYRDMLKPTAAKAPKQKYQPAPTKMKPQVICLADQLAAFQCLNVPAKDGYCQPHWDYLFKGMSNYQRMKEKKHLRNIIKQKEREGVQTRQVAA